jgi:hypothetical protein
VIAVEIAVGIVGGLLVIGVLGSAVRTVVVPRGEQLVIAAIVFTGVRRVFELLARRKKTWRDRDRIMARFGPVALLLLPLAWAVLIILGFSGVFWALGVDPWRDALVLSGSSLTTLGFRTTTDLPTLLLSITEGLIGLGIFALLISFLPTIYGAFSRREKAVGKLHIRSTNRHNEATAATLLIRTSAIGGLEQVTELWSEWEDWFVELEETHTSFPMLVFFRSPVAERSWITAAGLALDTAAIYASSVDLEHKPRAALMIRTGTLSLRRIADYFGFAFDLDPSPSDPISVEKHEFEAVYDELAESGVPLLDDRDQCWRNFAGWRVNYDAPLLALAAFSEAPPALWVSDRGVVAVRPRLFKRSRRLA